MTFEPTVEGRNESWTREAGFVGNSTSKVIRSDWYMVNRCEAEAGGQIQPGRVLYGVGGFYSAARDQGAFP